jgi:hypothetical protein
VAAKKKFVHLADMAPGAARNARVAALAANPGTRSKIPLALLPAKYQAGRKTAQRMAQENATLYNPAQILSGKDLRSAVKSTVDLQLNPQVAAFDRGIGTITNQRNSTLGRAAQYSSGYDAATAASAAGLSGAGQQLAAQIAAQGQNTQNVLSGIQSDDSTRRAADTALRGEGLQGPDQAAQQLNLAKANAAGATSSATNQAAAQAGSAANLAGTIAAVAPMRAQDQQFALAGKFNQQIADMTAKRADVEASRGDLTSTTLQKMRNDQFTNLATMKGLDLKASDLQETVRKNKATEDLTGRAIEQRDTASRRTARTAGERATAKAATDRANIDIKRGIDPITGRPLPKKPQSGADALARFRLDFLRKHGYLPSTGAPTGGPGSRAKPADVQKAQSRYTTVSSQIGRIARQLLAGQLTVPDPKNPKSTVKVDPGSHGRNWIVSNYLDAHPTADPLYISISADMAFDGHISKRNQDKLHARGLKVKDLEGVVPRGKFTSTKSAGRRAAKKLPGFGGF